MANYIDGFVLPVPRNQIETYRKAVEQIAKIWIEHGALDYAEYILNDPILEGTRTFGEAANATSEETIIFGWVSFESRDARDRANQLVIIDPRMEALTAPLTEAANAIYVASRMIYGGFEPIVRHSQQLLSRITPG